MPDRPRRVGDKAGPSRYFSSVLISWESQQNADDGKADSYRSTGNTSAEYVQIGRTYLVKSRYSCFIYIDINELTISLQCQFEALGKGEKDEKKKNLWVLKLPGLDPR